MLKKQVLTGFGFFNTFSILVNRKRIIEPGKDHFMNKLQIFLIRALLGGLCAVVIIRLFRPDTDIPYIIGLAICLVAVAYGLEYLRGRKTDN